jgi:hypothetical protein
MKVVYATELQMLQVMKPASRHVMRAQFCPGQLVLVPVFGVSVVQAPASPKATRDGFAERGVQNCRCSAMCVARSAPLFQDAIIAFWRPMATAGIYGYRSECCHRRAPRLRPRKNHLVLSWRHFSVRPETKNADRNGPEDEEEKDWPPTGRPCVVRRSASVP